jgi:hypothetical protein
MEKTILALQVAAGTYCLTLLVSMLIGIIIFILSKILLKYQKEEK